VQWKREIDSKVTLPDGTPLPVVLLANKCDLPDSRVDKEQLDAFCKEHGFIGWYETSAKSNHNIEESVKGLVSNILSHPNAFEAQRVKSAATAPQGTISLADEKDKGKDKAADKGCC
jgi:GTPase SAR1 family protein